MHYESAYKRNSGLSAVVAGHEELTLDADSPLAIQSRPQFSENSQDRFGIELLEGDSGASQQSDLLLQTRLRAAALAIGFGFTIFSLWTLFRELASKELHFGYAFMLFELATTITLIGIGIGLGCVQAASLKCLWWCELVIFGIPTLFLAALHYQEIVFMAPIFDLIPQMPMPGWIILIFAYALFVPRSWFRVLLVVVGISVFPLIATAMAMIMHPNVRDLIFHYSSSTVEMVLSLLATGFTAVSSVHMISQLRDRADIAKELGRYRLKQKIASGGMGDVYLAEHRLMKRPCAIKVIRPEKTGDPRAIARFEREVRATSRLNHWNSISIFDYGRTADGTFFYVMEYVTGLSVQELVKHRGAMAPARVVYLLKQACNAMLGGVAFYMLTGRPLFESSATMKILLSHLNEPAVAPSTVRKQTTGPTISPQLDSIVLKCLAKSPDDRFQSARELAEALNQTPEASQWTNRLAEQWWTCNCSQYQSENG